MKPYHKALNLIKRDPLLKLASLLIAIVLWFFVVVKGQTEITINVPIELKYIPKGLGVENKSNNTVMVTVRGFEQIIKNLKPYDVKVSLDLSRAKRGVNIIYLSAKDVMLPPSLTVTAIEPQSIKLRLDEIVLRRVPVKAELSGLSPDQRIVGLIIEPSTVEIEGFKSKIGRITYVKTEEISLEGITGERTIDVSLEPPPGYIRLNPETVRIKIHLRRRV